jgi:hypothetical protein
MGFDLNNYETVAERLVRWWVAYPDGQILTSIHYYDSDVVLFRAEGYNGDGKAHRDRVRRGDSRIVPSEQNEPRRKRRNVARSGA